MARQNKKYAVILTCSMGFRLTFGGPFSSNMFTNFSYGPYIFWVYSFYLLKVVNKLCYGPMNFKESIDWYRLKVMFLEVCFFMVFILRFLEKPFHYMSMSDQVIGAQ